MKRILRSIILFGLPLMATASIFGYAVLFSSKIGSDSMVPTYPVGGWTIENIFAEPKLGDVVVFQCLPDYQFLSKCNDGEDGIRVSVHHRLTGISPNGCMTIVGDNPLYNWDDVPCYMPHEIHISGVSHRLHPLFEDFIYPIFGRIFSSAVDALAQK